MFFNETGLTKVPMTGLTTTTLNSVSQILLVGDEEVAFIGEAGGVTNIWKLNTTTEQYEQLTFFEAGVLQDGVPIRILQDAAADQFNQEQIDHITLAGYIQLLLNNATAISGKVLHFMDIASRDVFEISGSDIPSSEAVPDRAVPYGQNRFVIESVINTDGDIGLTYYLVRPAITTPESSATQAKATYGSVVFTLFLLLKL